ncbi:hypothetical protein BsWGS_22607 [Bradybaena similaris]
MAKLLIAFLFCATLQAVWAGSSCTYRSGYFTYTTYCLWGCCSYEIDGCCDAPFYVGASFIAPVVIGSIILVVIIIVAAVISVRRRRLQTTIQYGAAYAQPQVVTSTTTTGANQYGAYTNQAYPNQGYPNQGYPPPPQYAAQPARY